MGTSPFKTPVIVGMSGGVDSSVAALVLKEQGFDVSGIFMQNWEDDDEHCTIRQDYRDASAVCDRLGIELSTVNFAEEYWQGVFQHFLDEYAAGRTPNPDILCNREIKFKAFLEHAKSQGVESIATGHYARITTSRADNSTGADTFQMLRGVDTNKDQTYFLYTLGQAQLKHTLFPVGELEKSAVRELARDAGFHLHGKKDSTGICFIGERKFRTFLSQYLPAKPGDMVTMDGSVIGRHNGLMYYTMGQRQGLGIGGLDNSDSAPWYVLEKNLESNQLIVGQGHDHPALFHTECNAHDLHWCADRPPASTFSCTAKTRYRQADVQSTVELTDNGSRLRIRFDQPVRAITPGQSLVLYDGQNCLGGGVISDFTKKE